METPFGYYTSYTRQAFEQIDIAIEISMLKQALVRLRDEKDVILKVFFTYLSLKFLTKK
jgi:hypothetical protein